MSKTGLLLIWVVSVAVSGVVGYQLGSAPDALPLSENVTTTRDSNPVELTQHQRIDEPETIASDTEALSQMSAPSPSSTVKSTEKPAEASEELDRRQKGERLEQLGEAFSEAQQQTLDHNELRKNFEREFDEHDRDLEAQNHFTDFLQLHQDSPLIELHKIDCTQAECQLLGQYAGEHEKWSDIVEQMQQQDWWQYRGTSSSSSTHEGVTYFNLYIDKGRSED